MAVLWGGLNDQLRRVGTGLAAGEADRRAAGRCESYVVGAIASDQGGEIYTGPRSSTRAT
jgi:hypothetical protein